MLKGIIFKIREMAHQKIIVSLLPPAIYLFLRKITRRFFYRMQIRSRVDECTVMFADYPRCGIGWLRFAAATALHYYHTGEFRKLSHSEMYTYVPTLAGREKYKPFYFNGQYSLLKTHREYVSDFKRAVIICRDPFRAIQSYYVHKLMEEGHITCRCLAGLTKEESFLIAQVQEYINFHESWLLQVFMHPDCYLVIKYEDLLRDTEKLFEEIFAFIKIDITNFPPGGLNKLVEMYQRRDVSVPLIGKKAPDEAFRIKFDILRQIEPLMTKEALKRLDSGLKKRLDTVIEKIGFAALPSTEFGRQ